METNTNWGQSVTAVVIREGRVILARHAYGPGTGKLIIPGGYVQIGETPQDAVRREYMEETGIAIEPREVIGIRFNMRDWYVAFRAEYVSGEPRSDGEENSEVLWLDIDEALSREDVPDLTKKLIQAAVCGGGLELTEYSGSTRNAPQSLYCKH
ncbi:MAG: NUDIX domain-containing protein [Ruminococcaceae bacterium]|nr:NUDIX domain-containing protein [Oscillospiraceae bacterium]